MAPVRGGVCSVPLPPRGRQGPWTAGDGVPGGSRGLPGMAKDRHPRNARIVMDQLGGTRFWRERCLCHE